LNDDNVSVLFVWKVHSASVLSNVIIFCVHALTDAKKSVGNRYEI